MAQKIGVVLAGGEGRRLGRNKGSLMSAGRPLARRAADALWPICGTVLVSVAAGAPNPAPGFPTVEDGSPAGRGPLAGIDAAFRAAGWADLVVLACDYPRIETAFLARLVELASEDDVLTVVTDSGGRDHPLVGLWRRAAAPVVRNALERERYKVRSLFASVRVGRLTKERFPEFDLDHELVNVNRPEDLRELEIVR